MAALPGVAGTLPDSVQAEDLRNGVRNQFLLGAAILSPLWSPAQAGSTNLLLKTRVCFLVQEDLRALDKKKILTTDPLLCSTTIATLPTTYL